MNSIYLMIPVAIGLFAIVAASYLVAKRKAQAGIKAYVAGRGGNLIDLSWDSAGAGWFPDKGTRYYRVRYFDRDGTEHEARCKANLWTGVHFTQDRVVRSAPPAGNS